MLGVCHGPRLGHFHHAAEEQRDLGRTVSGLSLSLALLSHPCEVMYPALVLVLVTIMFFEKWFFLGGFRGAAKLPDQTVRVCCGLQAELAKGVCSHNLK